MEDLISPIFRTTSFPWHRLVLTITQGQLSKIERGMLAPSVDVLLRLRERFRKSVDWMLSGE
jgi:transcriptional regulator with XRE-family HTH domain